MIEPTTVWAARLGSPDEGIKGWLVLETGHLVFTSDLSDIEIRIPLTEIRRARRIFGSPVMVVEHDGSVVAFYFAQPPPVIERKAHYDKQRQRASSLTYLGDTNASKRKEIKRWVQGVREAVKRARSS